MNMLVKKDKGDFIRYLKDRPFDDLRTIELIELELRKRGGVFKLPKPGSSVVLLLSGGLDSVVAWGFLMEEYKLKVYPVWVRNRQKKWKYISKSIRFFSRFYKKRYPDLFNLPFCVVDDFPQIEIENISKKVHSMSILDEFVDSKRKSNINLSSVSLIGLGRSYAKLLFLREHVDVSTIFCGILSNDGDVVPAQSFTSIRCNSLFLRVTTSENKWQFASVFYERELGNLFFKKDVIRWAFDHGIPIENTRSCYINNRFQCGECIACNNRKWSFVESGVIDKTRYMESSVIVRVRMFLNFIRKRLATLLFLNILQIKK